MEFRESRELLERLKYILTKLENFDFIKPERLYCVSSTGSKSRAIARIYSFPKVFQMALSLSAPVYVIEVISERFQKLSRENQDRVLIHELMHIPKTFSGALVPHKCFGKNRICDKTVEVVYKEFLKKTNED